MQIRRSRRWCAFLLSHHTFITWTSASPVHHMPPQRTIERPLLRAPRRHGLTLREKALEEVENATLLECILLCRGGPPHSITPSMIGNIFMHHHLTFQRYIYPNPSIARPSNAVYRDERLSKLSPIDFKDALRVTPRQFDYIVHLIADHPVFLSNGPTPSADPAIQLKIALHRLGHNGTLASFRSLGRTLDCSQGSVVRYTRNCIVALKDLQHLFLRWPNNQQKAEIKSRFGANYHFRECIGCVDRTMIDFDRAPAVDRNSWTTRKSVFSMGATGVCDHQGIFTHFSTGYLGTQHDSSDYKATTLYMSRSDKAGARKRGKIVFIANCRLRDKTRDHRGLYTGARCRPNGLRMSQRERREQDRSDYQSGWIMIAGWAYECAPGWRRR